MGASGKRPRIGQMRERLTLQAEALAASEGPSRTSAWVDVCTVWARVRPLSSREYFAQGQTRSAATHEVSVRAPLPGNVEPAAEMRLSWKGQTCEITTPPLLDERGRSWTFQIAC